MRSPTVLGLLVLTSLAVPAAAQGPTAADAAAPAAAEEVEAIVAEFDQAMSAFNEAYRAATTEEERQKAIQTLYPQPDAYVERLWTAIERAPESEGACTGLIWILQRSNDASQLARALDRLAASFPAADEAVDSLYGLVYQRLDDDALVSLEALLEESPSKRMRAMACLVLARQEQARGNAAQDLGSGAEPERVATLEASFGPATVARLREEGPEPSRTRAEEYLERIRVEFPDEECFAGAFGELAERQLFELKNLQIGMVAPEIEGEDLDGVPFKLSDYRGQVVVLDFWGDW